MSIVKMRKLTLIGLSSDKNRILRSLSRLRSVDVKRADELENTTEFAQDREVIEADFLRVANALKLADKIRNDAKVINKYSELNVKQHLKAVEKKGEELAQLSDPLTFANSTEKGQLQLYTPTKQVKFAAPKVFTFDEFESIISEKDRIFEGILDIETASKRIDFIKTEISKLSLLRSQLLVYRGIDAPFSSFNQHKQFNCFLGTVAKSKIEELQKRFLDISLCDFYRFDDIFSEVAFAVIYHKDVADEVSSVFSGYEIVKCPFNYSVSTVEQIRELNEEMFELAQECKQIAFDHAELNGGLKDIQTLYDFYNLEAMKLDAAEKCRQTAKTFLLEGWFPAEKEQEVADVLEDKQAVVAYEFSDPRLDELPPTLTKNNGFVSSFEGVTNMYGVPNYREHDPNGLLSIFYFLFFGIMLGDAGYGILVTIGCFAYLYFARKTKKKNAMIKMLGFCGISTILWGVVFGGWFAIENIGFLSALVWFNPLNEPLKMFALSLALGALQELVAFAVSGIYKAQDEKNWYKKLGILFSDFGWVVIMSAFFLVLPLMLKILGVLTELSGWQSTMVDVGKYFAFTGVGLLALGGILGKSNPIKMLSGIFGNFYKGISVVSDLLSYTRLFGLGLTSAVIGYVLNILAGIMVEMIGPVGLVIAIPVLLIGHAFNIGINMLGAYVHNARLQFIEFFGHFYDGSGYLYNPLGEKMKYTYIE